MKLMKQIAVVLSVICVIAVTALGSVRVMAANTYKDGDWEYVIKEGYAYVAGYKGNDDTITIPETASLTDVKYNVVGVAEDAFRDNKTIKKVTLPKWIKRLEKRAFKGCVNLSELVIEGDLETPLNIQSTWSASSSSGYSSAQSIFYNSGTNTDSFKVVFAEGVTAIPDFLFATNGEPCAVTEVSIADTVKSIGQAAFYKCNRLKKVSFGKELKSIGMSAFEDCENLEKVELKDKVSSIGEEAFYNCLKLKEVIMTTEDNKVSIGEAAFFNNKELNKVVLPAGGSSLGNIVFKNCINLTEVIIEGNVETSLNIQSTWSASSSSGYSSAQSIFYNSGTDSDSFKITFTEGVTEIPNYLFATNGAPCAVTEVSIADSVKKIGQYAFYKCTSLKAVDFGKELKSIGQYAFEDCEKLEKVELKDKVSSIGDNAFNNCKKNKEVIMTTKDMEINIGNNAFSNNYNLTKIILPVGGSHLGYAVFKNSTNLTEVIIEGNVESSLNIQSTWSASGLSGYSSEQSIFYNSGTNSDSFKITFAEGVTAIPDYLFATNGEPCAVTEVSIADSVKKIGQYAFYKCTKLKKVTMSANLEKIGDYAFQFDEKLTDIELMDKVNSIGSAAFGGCAKIDKVNIYDKECKITDSADVFDASTTICGYTGSTAEKFATKYKREFVSLDNIQDGLVAEADGSWSYYLNGKVQTEYTGLVCDANLGWWYVENGKINFNYNGFAPYGDAWWCVAGGTIAFGYTGLWSDPTVGWWYVENGTINFAYNGFVPFADAWWCVAGGRVAFEYTGLWSDPVVGWWYVENGTINFAYNGFVPFGEAWWCVAGGNVAFGYTGLWFDPVVGWWYVENGMINFGYNGVVPYGDAWFNVAGGAVVF